MTVAALVALPTFSPPDGRWWRFATCWRMPPNRNVPVAELTDCNARQLHFDLYGAGTAQCVMDGRSQQASALQELSQDLLVYRFDPYSNAYELFFQGPIGLTEDTISETTHTVNVTASDYRALLARSVTSQPLALTQVDQAVIFAELLAPYGTTGSLSGTAWDMGLDYLGVYGPDGTYLGLNTGMLRDRTYTGAEKTGDALEQLSQVINGFDFSVEPASSSTTPPASAAVKVWYPQRGVARPFIAEYGVTVGNLTRTVNSTSFANWVRMDGQNDASGNPLFAVSAGDVMANPQSHPEGLWQSGQSAADVSLGQTLQQQSDGQLALLSLLEPSYTVNLIPGTWHHKGDCWLGDSIELRIKSGRLDVDTSVRILEVDFTVDDNGTETIALTVGRSDVTFSDIMAEQRSRLDALSRR